MNGRTAALALTALRQATIPARESLRLRKNRNSAEAMPRVDPVGIRVIGSIGVWGPQAILSTSCGLVAKTEHAGIRRPMLL